MLQRTDRHYNSRAHLVNGIVTLNHCKVKDGAKKLEIKCQRSNFVLLWFYY